jgi:hypothetical protein
VEGTRDDEEAEDSAKRESKGPDREAAQAEAEAVGATEEGGGHLPLGGDGADAFESEGGAGALGAHAVLPAARRWGSALFRGLSPAPLQRGPEGCGWGNLSVAAFT